MKLSEKERLLIAASALQARASTRDLARETGLREHAVRYALDRLVARRLLSPMPIINISRLGLTDFGIYFSYQCPSRKERLLLHKYLLESPCIAWAAELAGEYQYGAALYGARADTVNEFFTDLSERCPGQLLNKAVATRLNFTFFPPKFLAPTGARENAITCGSAGEKVIIDGVDQAILRFVCRNASWSYASIARSLGVAGSTVESRVKALEEKGVVLGYAMQFDAQSAGVASFRIMLYEKHAQAIARSLFEYAAASPFTTCFVHCIGNWDYELSVRVPEPRILPEIVQEIYSRFGSELSGLRVLTALQRMKYCLFPFAADIAL